MNALVAAIYDRFMRKTEASSLGLWRRELLGTLSGKVLEVGAGTGVNLAFYPAAVRELVLAEPSAPMRRRLLKRLEREPDARVSVSAASAEKLPFPDASFDAVVVTLVLCSVAEPAPVLAEIRRVLAPGGRLVFIEHVAARDRPGRLAWQRRLEPVWRPLTGNCHLTRDTESAIVGGGFVLEGLARESMRSALPWLRPTIRGVARRPA